jgi:hypothetical protein
VGLVETFGDHFTLIDPGQRRLGNRGRRAAGPAVSGMRVTRWSLGEIQNPFV